MNWLKNYPRTLGFTLTLLACSSGLLLGERVTLAFNNPFNRAYNITHSAGLGVTQRGLKYLETELVPLLKANNIDLAKKSMPFIELKPESPFSLRDVPKNLKEFTPVFRFFRKELRNWLSNSSFHDPLFDIQIKEAGYEAEGIQFSVNPDLALTQTFQDGGVGLIVKANIPSIRIHAVGVRAKDLANPFLGIFGVDQPWIELRDSRPLEVTLPLHVKILPGGGIRLEALPAQTNIKDLHFANGNGELILPKVQFEITATHAGVEKVTHVTANTSELRRILMQKEPELIRILQTHLQSFIEKDLAAKIDERALKPLSNGFEMVNHLNAPENKGNTFKVDWGFRPGDIHLDENFLWVNLDGFVQDPEVEWDEKLPPMGNSLPPALSGMDPSRYDFALTINNDVVNRIMRLSYMRGPMRDQGANGKLMAVPTLTPIGGGLARMHLLLERPTDWAWGEGNRKWARQKFAINSPFQLDLDVIVKLRPSLTDPSAFDMIVDHIDENTGWIDPRYYRTAGLAEDIKIGLHEALQEENEKLKTTEMVLAPAIKIPCNQVSLQVVGAEFDVNGYMAVYLNHGSRKP